MSFTDEQVDELIKTSPPTTTDYTKFTLGEWINCPNYHELYYGNLYYEAYKLFKTISIDSCKKLFLHNPKLANFAISIILENQITPDRLSLIDWLLDHDMLEPNHALKKFFERGLILQINRLYNDPRIKDCYIQTCFDHMCNYFSENNKMLFDRLLNDPRNNPANNDNYPLSGAVLHKNDYPMNKLLADPRVQDCKNWNQVVESAFRIDNIDTIKLILDQPNAKFTREVLLEIKGNPKFDWVFTHPKYNPDIFKLKTTEQLLCEALNILENSYYHDQDKIKDTLKVALRRIRNEPEDADFDDESIAYVEYDPPWYERK